jgi:hypothetical protein
MTVKDRSLIAFYDNTGLIVTEDQKRQMQKLKACGFVLFDPYEYLVLTTENAVERIRIKEEARRLEKSELLELYNDQTRFGAISIPPYLCIECEGSPKGKVLGHDGRHRAAACIEAKVQQMPVFLIAMYHGISYDRLPKEQPYSFRHITEKDFPEEAIAQYIPASLKLPLETWVSIQQD